MENKTKNIELIKRHLKRGLRFTSGQECYRVINISAKNVGLFLNGTKFNISRELFYKILNEHNLKIINSWKEYESIIGN